MKTLIMTFICCFVMSQSLTSQTRDLDGFEKLRVSGGIAVTLIQSSDTKADIEIIKGDYDKLTTEVKGNTLVIKFKSKGLNWGNNNNKAKINLYYSSLNSIDISSGSSVKGEQAISSTRMDIDASSGSSCSIEVNADRLNVDVSSGSTVTLRGDADQLEVDASSGSTYDGSKFESASVSVDASSGSSAKVWATERLIADANSGGSVMYKGNPKKKDIDAGKWSGGSIKQMGGKK